MFVPTRPTRAGLAFIVLVLGACSDRTDPLAVPVHARRDVSPGAVLVVTNNNGGAVLGSLRATVNQTVGGETIHFDPSLAGAKITLDTTLDIPNNVTIEGPVDKGVTISGGNKFTVLTIHKGATLANLTITEGHANGANLAGGILDTGALVVKQSTITGNYGFNGAGIRGDNIRLINSTVTNNTVAGQTIDIASGIAYRYGGILSLINSSVTNNIGGAGLTPFTGVGEAQVFLVNSILSKNGVANCGLGILDYIYEGVNISSDKSCGTPALNMIVADPLLGPLADNGGPTQTQALDPNSPAINATDCPAEVTTDQRFVARDAKCDIGPFEFVFTTVTLTVDPNAYVDPTGAVTLTGTIQCSRDAAFTLLIDVNQDQKARKTPIVLDATQSINMACSTTAQPWIAQVSPGAGAAFENGAATATAQTVNVGKGVNPANVSAALKIFFDKK
jgi:hypothetical protein